MNLSTKLPRMGPAVTSAVFSPEPALVIMHLMQSLTPSTYPRLQTRPRSQVVSWRLWAATGVTLLSSLLAPLSLAEPVELVRQSSLYLEPVSVSRILGLVNAGAVVDTTGGRYGPWVHIRVSSGPTGWVQALDLALPASAGVAPALPEAVTALRIPPRKDAPPTAVMDAALLNANTPGMDQLVQAATFAQSTEKAREFGFSGGLGLVKLPRATRRTPGNAGQPPPIEPAMALEKTMGQSFAAKRLAGRTLVTDVATQHYINLLGRWLSTESSRPDVEWTFAVINDHGFDAFSAPGGYVFVTQGLLERVENEAELAGVLAHEIVMVAERYHLRGGVLDTPGLPDQLEADVLATELCARTGIEAYGLRGLLKRLAEVGMFSKSPFEPMIEHQPAPEARLAHLVTVIQDRFDNLEVAPARRIPDRLAELKTRSLDASPRAAR